MIWFKRLVLDHPWLWTLIILALTAGAIWSCLHLPVVTSTDAIIPRDAQWQYYEQFRQQFGADDAVAVAVAAPDVFDPRVLRYVRTLTEEFEQIEGVDDVLSLTNVEDIIGGEEDFTVEPLIGDEIPKDPHTLQRLKKRALKNPLILGNLVSKDFKTTLILIRTSYHGEDMNFEARLMKAVQKTLKKNSPPVGLSIHVSGWPVMDVKMAQYMNHDLLVFIPTTFVFLCLLVYYFLRSLRATLAIALLLDLSLIGAMACLKWVGGALSPMTSILAPLTLALALADGIHLITTYFRMQTQPRPLEEALRKTFPRHVYDVLQTVAESWRPCFLTSLTTAIGFASLMVSHVPSIRQFGAAAAAAMFIEYFLTFTLLVFLLPWIGRGTKGHPPSHWLVKPLVSHFPKWVPLALVIFLVATGLSLYEATKIRVDSDIVEYFHHSTPVYKDAIFIDKHLGGIQTIEISLKVKRGDFLNPDLLKKVEKIDQWLRKDSMFTEIVSPIEFFKLMNRAFHNGNENYYRLPQKRDLLAQYLLLYGGTELEHFMDDSQTWIRISARTPIHSSEKLNKKMHELNTYLAQIFDSDTVEYRLTGKTYLTNRVVDEIVRSQTESLAIAALLIFGLMFLVLKSLKIGLLSIPPNIFPIIANFGFMGFLGIPLNTATATISAVAIGIAVDDTIHLLVAYQNARKNKASIEAIKDALEKKGLAAITTSLVLIIGFCILWASKFVPTVQFGFLCAFVMLWALLADLFLTPALIKLGRKFF